MSRTLLTDLYPGKPFFESEHIPPAEWNVFSAIVDPEKKGSRIYFQRVPESKTIKNRLHLDINASTVVPRTEARSAVEAAVQRLTALGAREFYRRDEHNGFWVTMIDPEGNKFCIQ
jgi:hypothetical protein